MCFKVRCIKWRFNTLFILFSGILFTQFLVCILLARKNPQNDDRSLGYVHNVTYKHNVLIGRNVSQVPRPVVSAVADNQTLLKMIHSKATDLIHCPGLPFLKDLKNPCFWVIERKETKLMCLPYVFLAGFSKCATTDLYSKMRHHQHIVPGLFKELQFWTDRTDLQMDFEDYLRTFSPLAFINKYLLTSSQKRIDRSYIHEHVLHSNIKPNKTLLAPLLEKSDLQRLITLDATAANVFEAFSWQDDPLNMGHLEPKVVAPQRISSIHPRAKIIVIMRNPVERIFSDFKYHTGNRQSVHYFHRAVVNGIQWWKDCLNKLLIYKCAYGWNYSGTGVESLGSSTVDWGDKTPTGRGNGAGRMRTSIYVIYIKKWLQVFPRENFLFLRTEDYSKNITTTLTNEVFPFLGLERISTEAAESLRTAITDGRKNVNKHFGVEMLNETRELLNEFYEPYNVELSLLLNDSKYLWNDR